MGDEKPTYEELERRCREAESRLARMGDEASWYRLLFDRASQGVGYYDLEGRVISFNEVAARRLNGRPEDFVGKSVSEMFGAEVGEEYFRRMREAIETRQEVAYEDLVSLPDGKRWFLCAYTRIDDAEGRPAGVQVVATDIMAQKRIETDLRASEAFHRAILNTTQDGFWVLDREGRFIDMNVAWCESLGYSRDEMLELCIQEVDVGAAGVLAAERMRRVIQNGSEIFEARHRRKDGSRFDVEVSATYLDNDGGCFVCFGRDITHRKRAERALRESESKMRSIFSAAPVGIGLVVSRVLVDVNEQFCEMTGYLRKDILGRNTRLIYPTDEDYEYVGTEKYRQIAQTGTGTVETRFLRKDGEIIDVVMSSAPLDPDDLSAGVTFTALDITDRKRAEQALKEERDYLQRLMKTSPVGITRVDRDGCIVYANEQAQKVLGLTASQIDRLHYNSPEWHITDTEGKPVPDSELPFSAVRRTGQPVFDIQQAIQWPDGHSVLLSINASPLLNALGEFDGIVAMISDITARYEAEQKYTMIFRGMIDGFAVHELICDENGTPVDYRFLDINPAFERMTGLTRDVVGKTVLEILPDTEMRWIETYGRVALTGEPVHFENYAQELDKHFEVTAFRSGPMRFACVFMDITERIHSEQERRRLEEQYRQAQKMEAVGQLTGGVAHDFNNLLQVINGATEMALEDMETSHPARESMLEVAQAGQRAARLVSQLLLFSRRQIMRPEALDFNQTVADLLKMLGRVIGEHIQLQWHPAARLAPVCADRGMVEQALMNLCVNARDAMPGGGSLTIETRDITFDDTYCNTHAEARPGRYAMLSVTDTGSGMDPGTMEHVFEPFFTTKGTGKGTGLGLATVYGIVRQHDGLVNIYSEVDRGTVVKLYWPVSDDGAASEGGPAEKTDETGTETILLAEDDEMVRNLATAMLERAGYTVLVAENGEEAVAIFEKNDDRIDLAILDVVMPGMGGREAYEHMHAARPDMPVLFASGYSENAIHTNFVLHDGLELIQKPFTRSVLLDAVRRALS